MGRRSHLRGKWTRLACFLVVSACPSAPLLAQQSDPQPYSPQTPDAPYHVNVPPNYRPAYSVVGLSSQGSTYVPMDSWIYPALDRLHGLGYLDTAFVGMRPYTRLSIAHMLEETDDAIESLGGTDNDEATEIYLAIMREIAPDLGASRPRTELDTVYSRFLGITDTPLRDSYHLGQTIANDYGRPYQAGISNSTGFSARGEAGRFTLMFRGEYQHAPSAQGYSLLLGAGLSYIVDAINPLTNQFQATIPLGPIHTVDTFRVMEANASFHAGGHEISFGKSDHWLSPARGGSFAWSNNAENIYAFEINRVEPLRIPLLSRLIGPVRYDFFVGSLKGHSAPNHPFVHVEKISFQPTRNLEFGFERTVIWGGRGHEPVTLDSFFRSFFSASGVSLAQKFSRTDPGARFGSFDFSYQLPYLRNWLTLYTDSLVHDDVSPVSAPRRAGIRPGVYLSHFPGLVHLDLRVEGASTDPPTSRSIDGMFLDYEGVQQQGTTNKGFLFGDAIGREDKGGDAWLTYHLSPYEHVQVSYRRAKAAKDFIPFGTTQNEYKVDVIKRLGKDVEINVWAQYEQWKAPIYKLGSNSDTSVAGQVTWYPHKDKLF